MGSDRERGEEGSSNEQRPGRGKGREIPSFSSIGSKRSDLQISHLIL